MKYFISLGSNLGDRKKNLATAFSLLEDNGVSVVQASSIYKTQPVDLEDQPWFYNQVLEVETDFAPMVLLSLVKSIEKSMKRLPTVDKGPRTIDIDILLAGRTVIQTQKLMIPHPRLNLRNFVLVPLKEIAPGTVHPVLHESIDVLSSKSADASIVKKIRINPPALVAPPGPGKKTENQALRPSRRFSNRNSLIPSFTARSFFLPGRFRF